MTARGEVAPKARFYEAQEFCNCLVIVGLGNPGKKYETTRHNIGFIVLQEVAKKWNWQLKEKKDFGAWIAKGEQSGAYVHLLFPAIFMNNSGFVVRRYLDYYHLSAKNLIVVSDEIALPFGVMRLGAMGSSGGHNGLKSIENCLQTRDYIRLRLGIGCPLKGENLFEGDLASYVLSSFNPKEMTELSQFVERAVSVLERLLKETVSRVMSDVNKSKNEEKNDRKESASL